MNFLHFKSRTLGLTLILFTLAAFQGCKPTKDIAKKPTDNEVKHLEQLIFNDKDFRSLDSKVEFKFIPKDGVSAGMRGTVKLKRDSCILLSVQPFAGIEAVKCLIRKDSLFIVSRLHKTYAVEDLRQMTGSLYMNLKMLQALLSNKVFVPGVVSPTEKDFKKFEWHRVKSGDYFRWPDQNCILDFCLNEEGQYNALRVSNPEKQEKVTVSYAQFQKTDSGTFPNQLILTTEGAKQTFKVQVTYLKPTFDKSTNFGFEIPAKYKQVTTGELIKRFQTML